MNDEDIKQIIYNIPWEVGYHQSFDSSNHNCIYECVKTASSYGAYSVQFFLGSPQTYNRYQAKQKDIDKVIKYTKKFPMNIFSHFPYLSNLVGSVKSLAWNGDAKQDEKTQQVIDGIEYELGVLSNFTSKKSGVVIHPGSYKDRKVGCINIAKSINKINFVTNSKLILENSAGAGTTLGTTFEELKLIIDNVDEAKQKYLGVCVDTAHIWGYGSYDLRKCEEVDRMFEEFDSVLGIERFTLLHLNDSLVPFNSRVDKHAYLGTGYIWNDSFKSLLRLLNNCKKYDIPIILETRGQDMIILACLNLD